ncbi:hypothetical protein FCM35_KLT06167 [Carex littledalei]|uniref:Uncharacterized protein n=1 Tax=Carex littledalei TaxID=544730 RepID=A0A833R3R7_9POAL|nr:hypothetical protein FCM35_KLT06167 [Carex littledalei]
MEGLIPFVYRSILHYINGGQIPAGNPFFFNVAPVPPHGLRQSLSSDDVASSDSNASQSPHSAKCNPCALSNGAQSPHLRVPINKKPISSSA